MKVTKFKARDVPSVNTEAWCETEMFQCHSNEGFIPSTSKELLKAPEHWGILEDSWGVAKQQKKGPS